MKGEFDEHGKLSIYRNGILKRQYCPRPGKDYHVCQCSDDCPGILENGDRNVIFNCFGHSIKIMKDQRKSEEQ